MEATLQQLKNSLKDMHRRNMVQCRDFNMGSSIAIPDDETKMPEIKVDTLKVGQQELGEAHKQMTSEVLPQESKAAEILASVKRAETPASKAIDAKKKTKKARRTTVRKVMPIMSENGHVQGPESLNTKRKGLPNTESKSWMQEFRFTNVFTMPLRAYTNARDLVAGDPEEKRRIQREEEAKKKPSSTSAWDNPYGANETHMKQANAPSDYSMNEHNLKSMKAEKLSARHMRSSCAVERELFYMCLKERKREGNNCVDKQQAFRRCNEEAVQK